MTNIPGWTRIADEPTVLVREYRFGPGLANALAISLPDRKVLLVSPPAGVPTEELKQLEEVVALLEFNGVHHLGLAPCRAAFPRAISYASQIAAARIRKKAKDPGQLQPLDTLRRLLGDRVSLIEVPGGKVGDVLVRVQTDRGTLLYAGDFVANIPVLPKNLLFRLMFKLSDSAPGFKVFHMFFRFFVKERATTRDFLIGEVQAHPPSIVVPAHGNVLAQPNLGPTLTSMLRAL